MKQHMMPVLPRNQRKPMKRKVERKAVEYRMILKKAGVRVSAAAYRGSLLA